jgi:hypothetical protein
MFRRSLLILAVILIAACSRFGVPGGAVVPTTGNTSNDAAAAQQYVPDLPGYISTNASSIASAVSTISGGASILSGNLIGAAMVAQIDGMISCYQQVGAVAAKVYAQVDIASVASGQIPSVGALAVVNQDRIAGNFLPCALGSGKGFSAQSAAPEPCANSGTFSANGNNYLYIYAASNQDLCTLIASRMPSS